MARLVITVTEIKGTCPVYRRGDRIVLDEGYRLNLAQTDAVCLHSLASVMPYYVALSKGVDPRSLGLSRDGRRAYVQIGEGVACLDLRSGKPLWTSRPAPAAPSGKSGRRRRIRFLSLLRSDSLSILREIPMFSSVGM